MNSLITRRTLAIAGLLAATLGRTGRAALTYVPEAAQLSLGVGETRTLNVYLRETGTTQIAAEDGLFGAAFAVTRGASAAIGLGAPAIASTFDATQVVDQPQRAGAGGNRLSRAGFIGPVPDAGGLILLGSVSVTALAAGSSTFTIGDLNPTLGQDDVNTYAGSVLDVSIAPGTFVVSTPEPATLAAAAIGVVGFVARRRRGA